MRMPKRIKQKKQKPKGKMLSLEKRLDFLGSQLEKISSFSEEKLASDIVALYQLRTALILALYHVEKLIFEQRMREAEE
jgi:hypothetical protein